MGNWRRGWGGRGGASGAVIRDRDLHHHRRHDRAEWREFFGFHEHAHDQRGDVVGVLLVGTEYHGAGGAGGGDRIERHIGGSHGGGWRGGGLVCGDRGGDRESGCGPDERDKI